MGTIWYALNYMQMELFPGSAADAFYAYVELPVSASLEKTSDKVKEIEELISAIPKSELESFATRIGNHGPLRPGESDNWAYINVNLTPFAKRKRTALEIVEELREKSKNLKEFKEITYDVDEGGPPVGKPLVIRIVGADNQKRRELTDKVEEYLSGINGVTGIERNDTQGKKQVQINLDYDRIADLGLSVADVARTIRIAYNGEIVTDVSFENEEVEFRLILEENARANTAHLMNLLVPNRRGRLISLRDFASTETVSDPSNFYHYEGERAIKITADIVEDTTTPVQVTQNVLNHFDLEKNWQGMRFEVGGEAQETKESFRSLYFAFGVAVIAIYFLLIVLFDSFTQPLTVIIAIPFGVISVIAAFALHGKTPGFMAMMGLVGLSGVVVNDSLVMVSHINRLRREKYDSIKEAVSQGASDRLRPVIMTTLTTVVGLVPLAYGIGGSDPFVAPLALALGYGLLFATPLTLFIVPCLYMIREDIFSLFGKSGLP
jgi:multidrug efflux pump subunit AcrB